MQDGGRALGASIAALGLSNKAVYDGDDDDDADAAEQQAGHQYPDGPDIAPESAPSAVAGAALHAAVYQGGSKRHPRDAVASSCMQVYSLPGTVVGCWPRLTCACLGCRQSRNQNLALIHPYD